MISNSLTFRLIVTSAIWVTITLVAVAVLLTLFFQSHVEEHFDAFLFDHLEENIAAARLNEKGEFYLTWVPADLRFNEPHSGWYWQVDKDGVALARSDSLLSDALKIKLDADLPGSHVLKIRGPGNEKLRAIATNIALPGFEGVYTFSIAGSVYGIERDVENFTSNLGMTLILLGIGLIIAIYLQIKVGLKPLRLLKETLSNISSGKETRLPESFPSEVQPVVHELNFLLDHSEGLLERARTQVGDLAHALKNPLTVIRNEADGINSEQGRLISEKAAAMGAYVERYLSRARAAGSANIIGASVDVLAISRDIGYLMEHMYQDKNLNIVLKDLKGLQFKGDAQDLEEMLGNLMDNACKWANNQVIVQGDKKGSRIYIRIQDDGPGIPGDKMHSVLKRGQRLDETVPGSGLGLGIVLDLSKLYNGDLKLDNCEEGGLCAELELPAADSSND